MAENDPRKELEELRRIDELERKASGGKNTSAPPPPPPGEKPSLGEQAYAGAYGLGTGILGGVGELESMVQPPVQSVRGYETVFPTQKNVQEALTKIGVPPPAKGTETAQFVGEIAPAVVAGGKGLYDLSKFGITKAADLAKTLLGKKTAAQSEQVSKAAREAEKAGGQALTAAEQQQRALLEAETAKALKRQEAAQTRQSIAQRAGEKAERAGGRSLRELVGVKTLPELGAYKPVPATPEKIGEYIRKQADNFLDAIKKQRSQAADVNFTKATIDAQQKQARGQYVNTEPLLAEMDALIAKGGTTDYLNSIQRLRNDIANTPNFEGLEVIRRRLGDAAFGVPEEGYKAIGQKFSQKMYDDLAGQMRDFDKSFAKYLDDYKRLSEPIRVYGTKVGKSLTQTEDAAGRYIAKPPEKLADEIFSSPQNFDRFLEAIGNNAEIATSAARRYFANKLETAKTPEAIEKIVRDNRELLRRPEMREVARDIENYSRSLAQSERRAVAAKGIVGAEEKVVKEIPKQIQEIDKQVEGKLKGIAESRKLFSDSVEAMASAKPGQAIKTFEETVLPKIRQAEEKAGTKLISEQQVQALREEMQRLEKISDKTTRTRVISGVLATYLIGQEGVSKLKQLAGMPSGE